MGEHRRIFAVQPKRDRLLHKQYFILHLRVFDRLTISIIQIVFYQKFVQQLPEKNRLTVMILCLAISNGLHIRTIVVIQRLIYLCYLRGKIVEFYYHQTVLRHIESFGEATLGLLYKFAQYQLVP